MAQNNVVKGSIADAAKGKDISLALMRAAIAVVGDTSGSTNDVVLSKGITRWAVEQGVLEDIQGRYPGKVVVVSFADEAVLNLDGMLCEPSGGTEVMKAFVVAKELVDMGIRVVFTSDGEHSYGRDRDQARQDLLDYARDNLAGHMDVIFIGDENGGLFGNKGAEFMRDLARIVNGQYGTFNYDQDPKFLTEKLEVLLLSAGK